MSSLEPGDRRRLLAAGVTTIAVLPFLFGGGSSPNTGVATIGEGANLAGALDSSAAVPQEAPANDVLRPTAMPAFSCKSARRRVVAIGAPLTARPMAGSSSPPSAGGAVRVPTMTRSSRRPVSAGVDPAASVPRAASRTPARMPPRTMTRLSCRSVPLEA